MAHKLRFCLATFAMAIVSIIMYAFVHESGHALVAILCGANNVKISIVSAHTWWTGGSFTVITDALCNAAGAVLPVCASWIAMMFYTKDSKSAVYHLAYFFLFIVTTFSVLVWVGIPVYSMFTPFPDQTDDVVKFLNGSGISPVIVSLTGVIVILFSIFIAVKKQLFHTLIQFTKELRHGGADSKAGIFVSNKSMSGIAIAVLIAIFIAVLFELPGIMAKPIVSFTIADEVPETVTYRTFDIQQENIYHFRTQLDAGGLLVVVGISNQAQELVFQNLIYNQVDSNSTFNLSPGTYTLSVTYLPDADIFDSYCSAMGYNFEDWEMESFTAVYEQETHLSRLFIELR